jgi:hypothetical protein
MPTILGGSGLGDEESGSLDSGLSAALGRISGKLLSANLVRHGVDLAFDTDLLYLKVGPIIQGTPSIRDPVFDNQDSSLFEPPYSDGDPNYGVGTSGNGVGINTNNPIYTLDVASNARTEFLDVTNTAYIDNLYLYGGNTISTTTGEIHIRPFGPGAISTFDILGTVDGSNNASLFFNGNTVQSYNNKNIVFNPAGTGTIELQSNTTIVPNNILNPALYVTGNITLDGSLRTNSNIFIGDSPMDVVQFDPDVKISQDLSPGQTLTWDLGKSDKRWSTAYIDDWTKIGTLRPTNVNLDDQVLINGSTNTIQSSVTDTDLFIAPDTGRNNIEQVVFESNSITSLMQQPDLDPYLVADGIRAAALNNPNAAIFNTTVSGVEYFLGGGQTIRTERTSLLGDVRNDLDNPGVLNEDDAVKVIEIATGMGSTDNEAIWYYTKIVPAIKASPTEYAKWGNVGTSLADTPFTISSSNDGYVSFADNNGLVIPVGTTAERNYGEVGMTRWNSELQQLECFDGERYIVATGPGAVVTNDLMVELAITRALFLG